MAEVWEWGYFFFQRPAWIKFLLPEFARNQELQERFLNEAKRQAQLRHTNIVPCTDFFQVDGRSYMVMEYVEGQSLDARLQKSNPPLTLNEIHTISWDVLSALDYAHSLDVVHRDVSRQHVDGPERAHDVDGFWHSQGSPRRTKFDPCGHSHRHAGLHESGSKFFSPTRSMAVLMFTALDAYSMRCSVAILPSALKRRPRFAFRTAMYVRLRLRLSIAIPMFRPRSKMSYSSAWKRIPQSASRDAEQC